ncbi:unnamed protein product [Staphylococcus haemolyticus JCSC1435]|uniref:Uncharacterized protein n=3 Tax=Staphylococcus TaxID=1279 RepID=Q4L396_STAHJ|nr:unnamed protein product [Staphylococcus haemolyticus JCSC1435]
MKMFEENRIVK